MPENCSIFTGFDDVLLKCGVVDSMSWQPAILHHKVLGFWSLKTSLI